MKTFFYNILCCLMIFSNVFVLSGQELSDQQEDINRMIQKNYNYKLYESITAKPIISKLYIEKALERDPKADLIKFPMVEYFADSTKLSRIKVGEALPDALLDLPLWVTNDEYGRDTITLRSEMTKQWLVLDIWTEWCTPCLKSMDLFEKLANEKETKLVLMGLYSTFYPHVACSEARKRNYKSVQIIGPSMTVIKRMLVGWKSYLGPAIWIKDGYFFGVTEANRLSEVEYRQLLSGEIDRIPSHAAHQNLR